MLDRDLYWTKDKEIVEAGDPRATHLLRLQVTGMSDDEARALGVDTYLKEHPLKRPRRRRAAAEDEGEAEDTPADVDKAHEDALAEQAKAADAKAVPQAKTEDKAVAQSTSEDKAGGKPSAKSPEPPAEKPDDTAAPKPDEKPEEKPEEKPPARTMRIGGTGGRVRDREE